MGWESDDSVCVCVCVCADAVDLGMGSSQAWRAGRVQASWFLVMPTTNNSVKLSAFDCVVLLRSLGTTYNV